MTLCIKAQDIRFIEIGIAKKNKIIKQKIIETSPELYLMSIKICLDEWKILLQEISSVYIVTGPGSFTASRISVIIANAIHFSKKIPLFFSANPENKSLNELYKESIDNFLLKNDEFAIPEYRSPARITFKKD